MKPYFTHHVVAGVLFAITVVVWVVGEIRQSMRVRTDAKVADRQSRSAIRLCGLAAWILAAILQSKVPGASIGGGVATFAAGLALMWCGITLRFWAFRTLGAYFTFTVMTSEDQEVVARGPYRVLRHPSYAAIAVILIGLGLLYGNWLSLAVLTVLPMAAIVYRIHVEEAALVAELGERYRSFAASRKRLVPYVW